MHLHTLPRTVRAQQVFPVAAPTPAAAPSQPRFAHKYHKGSSGVHTSRGRFWPQFTDLFSPRPTQVSRAPGEA